MILRQEMPADSSAVREVHLRAFERPGVDVAPEATLVGELRDDGDVVPGLSIVAVAVAARPTGAWWGTSSAAGPASGTARRSDSGPSGCCRSTSDAASARR